MKSFLKFISEDYKDGDKYFSSEALESAKNPPPYNPNVRRPGLNPEYDKVIHMHPEHFLSVARKGTDPDKAKTVDSLINSNTKFSDLPELHFTHSGNGDARVTGHEGRHRARALLDKGITNMPVILRQRYNPDAEPVKWNSHFGGKFPHTLHGEISPYKEENSNADNSIPFPVKDPRINDGYQNN